MSRPAAPTFPRLAPCLAAVGLALGGPAFAGGDLVLRVHDVMARPGGLAAITFSTYEPVPIEQGQICFSTGSARSVLPERLLVLDPLGDSFASVSAVGGGELLLGLQSPTGTLNSEDGAMLALYFRVPAGAPVGATLPLSIDAAQSAMVTAAGQTLSVDPRVGSVTIIPADSPLWVLPEAPSNVLPGQDAVLGIETMEALRLTEAIFGLRYDPAIAAGPPDVVVRSKTADLRHQVDVSTPGLVRVHVVSVSGVWNRMPGALVELTLPTRGNVPLGTESEVWLDPALTRVRGPDGVELPLATEAARIRFR